MGAEILIQRLLAKIFAITAAVFAIITAVGWVMIQTYHHDSSGVMQCHGPTNSHCMQLHSAGAVLIMGRMCMFIGTIGVGVSLIITLVFFLSTIFAIRKKDT